MSTCETSFVPVDAGKLAELCEKARHGIEMARKDKMHAHECAHKDALAKWEARSWFGKWWFSKPDLYERDGGWPTEAGWTQRRYSYRKQRLKRIANSCRFSTVVNLSLEDMQFVSSWAESEG